MIYLKILEMILESSQSLSHIEPIYMILRAATWEVFITYGHVSESKTVRKASLVGAMTFE